MLKAKEDRCTMTLVSDFAGNRLLSLIAHLQAAQAHRYESTLIASQILHFAERIEIVHQHKPKNFPNPKEPLTSEDTRGLISD